tara:strand:- start:780 stop:1127 length:348 start_codon:yes stop_codon:yes gene_type:complete
MAKRKTIRALFEDLNNLRAEEIAKSQQLKELLKSQVPLTIYDAHLTNKQYASIFEINDSENYIEISKKDWISALETCISWFLETEEYEKCTKLKAIIVEIQNKPKKITIKKDKHE